MTRTATLFALAGSATAACSDAPAHEEPHGQVRAAIQGGAEDAEASWVVGLVNDRFRTICSGSLIAPNLVLTTRHCIDFPAAGTVDCASTDFERVAAEDDLFVTTCADIRDLGASTTCEWHRSAKIYRPRLPHFCGNDIALVLLAHAVPSSEATPAIPLLQPMRPSEHTPAASFSAIGFGAADPSKTAWGIRRRIDKMAVSCVGEHVDCRSFAYGSTVAASEFVSAAGSACDGDSGGPAALLEAGEPARLFGVASRAGTNDGQCVSSIYTRLDTWSDWIPSIARTAAAYGDYDVPAWALPKACAAGQADGDASCASPPSAEGAGCSMALARGRSDPEGIACFVPLIILLMHRRRSRCRAAVHPALTW